ncbi:hypothetical protein [Tenacibaculum piscium]|uniref:hypothetical protein n=1 Tax=Tenacibaculum piscium TaxID=1458515 RepID=UPI001F1FF924|nr:hypothetical protein [Tenacibaculum piscium]
MLLQESPTHYNLKGEKTQYNTYNKGEIIGSIKNNGNKGIPGRLSFDDIKNLRVPGMLTFKDLYYKNDYNVEHHYGSYMPVRTEHYIDWYKKIDGQYIFLGSKLQYVSHEYTYVPNNHHYTNGYHPNDNVYYEHHTGTGKIPQHIYDNFKEKQIREILSEPTLSLKSQEIEYENKIK